jgi:hypothetical protein
MIDWDKVDNANSGDGSKSSGIDWSALNAGKPKKTTTVQKSTSNATKPTSAKTNKLPSSPFNAVSNLPTGPANITTNFDTNTLKKNVGKKQTGVDKQISGAIGGFLDSATFGLYNKNLEDTYGKEATKNQKSVGGVVGNIAGSLLPVGGAYKVGGKVLSKVSPAMTGIKKTGALGALAMGAYETGNQILDATLDTKNDGKQTLGERSLEVGKQMLYGAGGDIGFQALGKVAKILTPKAKAYLSKLKGNTQEVVQSVEKTVPSVTKDTQPLLLMEGKKPRVPKPNENKVGDLGTIAIDGPVIGQVGKKADGTPLLGLPSGLPKQGIKATQSALRIESKSLRADTQAKLDAFVEHIKDLGLQKIKPEEQYLWDNEWSKIAGPKDPSLQDAIDIAFTSENKFNQNNLDALRSARELQRMREVSGISKNRLIPEPKSIINAGEYIPPSSVPVRAEAEFLGSNVGFRKPTPEEIRAGFEQKNTLNRTGLANNPLQNQGIRDTIVINENQAGGMNNGKQPDTNIDYPFDTTATEGTGTGTGRTGDGVRGNTNEQGVQPGGRTTNGPKSYVAYEKTTDNVGFHDAIRIAKENNPHGAYVNLYDVGEYANKELFLSPDGQAGMAVTSDGDIVSVFKNPNNTSNDVTHNIMLTALENGGSKLDCFAGFLPTNYAKYGFKPVARVKFDPEFAPDGWNFKRDGQPDVVMMVHNGESHSITKERAERLTKEDIYKLNEEITKQIESLPYSDYDGAVKIQSIEQEKLLSVPTSTRMSTSDIVSSIANSDDWKNKGMLRTVRETMDRIIEDIAGSDAPQIISKFFNPVRESEAIRQNFLSKQRDEVKSLGIKYKGKEDALVQKYGEGLITLSELKNLTPNWQQVKVSAETLRKKYNEFFDMANQVLERNGYPLIPYRKNYFPHYQEMENLFTKFGLKMDDFSLPTDLIGKTADLKPGKNFFNNALRRLGTKTDYGAIEGFERYINGVSKIIYQTDNIKNLRSLEDALREKYTGSKHLVNFVSALAEKTNVIAGKKAMIDRGLETYLGRPFYTAMDALRSRVGGNMIGGSISTAITNFIPLTQAMATTEKKAILAGMFESMARTFTPDDLTKRSAFLTRRFPSDPLNMNNWQKFSDKISIPFQMVDRFVSESIVRGKYYEGIRKGMNPDKAMAYADDWAGRLMADRSLGQMPIAFDSRTLGLLTQFQLEVNNQLSFLMKDIPRSYNKVEASNKIAQVLIYGFIFNQLYEPITGRKPALDPIGVAIDGVNKFKENNISNGEATWETMKGIGGQLPIVSTMVNGGRIPISSAFPNIPNMLTGKTEWWKEIQKPFIYVLPPAGGGQLKKTIEGATALGLNPIPGFKQEKAGEYRTNVDGEKVLKYPIDRNPLSVAKGLTFGKYSFKQANDYYDNKRRELTFNQTKEIDSSPNRMDAYNNLMGSRRLDTINNKIDKVYKKIKDGETISKSQQAEVDKLMKEYNRIKNQK